MKRNDLVSVIMPAYNMETYIEEALLSIIHQTYQNWELIVIDDGSEDKTADIVERYRKEDWRIKLISRENRGLVHSLNQAIENAAGNYIARMDADDSCDSSRLEKQISYLWKHPEVHLVGSNVRMIFEEGVTDELRSLSEKNEYLWNEPIDSTNRFASNMEGFKLVHPTWMIRKELFKYIGKYTETVTEDAEFLFRTVIHGFNVDKIQEPLYFYRIRNASKSDEDRKGNLHKQEIIKFKLEYLEKIYGKTMETMQYVIWGADVSGKLALDMLHQKYPNAVCRGIIDGVKSGEWNGWKIAAAEKALEPDVDFVFLCTRGGAQIAKKFLEQHGKEEIQDFMKIS